MAENNAAILSEVDDMVRAERLERFWREQGIRLLSLCVLILVAVAGVLAWQWRAAQGLRADAAFLLQADRLAKANDRKGAEAALSQVEAHRSRLSPYAYLQHAALLASLNDAPGASALYASAVLAAGGDKALADFARLQGLLLAPPSQGTPDYAGIEAPGRPYSGFARDLKAADLLAQGKKREAVNVMRAPEMLLDSPPSLYRLLQEIEPTQGAPKEPAP
jgi:predicted negative regulator of RcsB-dependent stress response